MREASNLHMLSLAYSDEYFLVRRGGDVRINSREIEERKTYYRSLRRLLTEKVRGAFEEQHEQPDARIADLIQRLDEQESVRRR